MAKRRSRGRIDRLWRDRRWRTGAALGVAAILFGGYWGFATRATLDGYFVGAVREPAYPRAPTPAPGEEPAADAGVYSMSAYAAQYYFRRESDIWPGYLDHDAAPPLPPTPPASEPPAYACIGCDPIEPAPPLPARAPAREPPAPADGLRLETLPPIAPEALSGVQTGDAAAVDRSP